MADGALLPGWLLWSLPAMFLLHDAEEVLFLPPYYGRGPKENYRDRRTSQFIGEYAIPVKDMYEPYVKFAPLFWERNCYSLELQEYQRIAVLVSLDAIHSGLLPQYLEQAKQDGRRYLLEHAKRIEGGLAMNEKMCIRDSSMATQIVPTIFRMADV